MAQPQHTHLPEKLESVQTHGRKKKATAVALVTKGTGMIRVNGVPLHLVEPQPLRTKLFEPILLLGQTHFEHVDIRVRVRGGGNVGQIYAARQAIARGIIAYYQKYVDEAAKRDLKDALLDYDKTLLISDPRRKESKKFGGHGARARRQKSYR